MLSLLTVSTSGLYITIYLLLLVAYESEYRQITTDEIGITVGDTLLPLKPFYIGIGGDINFFDNLYTEGHIGKIDSGFGFRGFLGYDTETLETH